MFGYLLNRQRGCPDSSRKTVRVGRRAARGAGGLGRRRAANEHAAQIGYGQAIGCGAVAQTPVHVRGIVSQRNGETVPRAAECARERHDPTDKHTAVAAAVGGFPVRSAVGNRVFGPYVGHVGTRRGLCDILHTVAAQDMGALEIVQGTAPCVEAAGPEKMHMLREQLENRVEILTIRRHAPGGQRDSRDGREGGLVGKSAAPGRRGGGDGVHVRSVAQDVGEEWGLRGNRHRAGLLWRNCPG